jgi:GNAT superfamily N-acetyltransferase
MAVEISEPEVVGCMVGMPCRQLRGLITLKRCEPGHYQCDRSALAMLTLPEAIDVVTAGLACSRSVVAPAEVIRHGPLWILRDTTPKPGKARTEEIFAFGASPAEVVRALHDYAPQGNYAIEPFLTPDDDLDEAKAEYKALGFRLSNSEPRFVCPLAKRNPVTSSWPIRRVASLDEARSVCLQVYGKANRKLRLEDLTSPTPAIRLYWVEMDGQAVAAARSVMPQRTATCLLDVSTLPEFRRRGIATALFEHVLAEDARCGSEHNVLLASRAGSKLYPILGYEQRALLQIYNLARER